MEKGANIGLMPLGECKISLTLSTNVKKPASGAGFGANLLKIISQVLASKSCPMAP